MARRRSNTAGNSRTNNDSVLDHVEFIPCTIKQLEPEQKLQAAIEAIRINPGNAVSQNVIRTFTLLNGTPPAPDHLALMTDKYWGGNGVDLTVSFMDNPTASLRSRILSHMNAWGQSANVKFREVSAGGQVRIARESGQGYWSYLGTDILHVPSNEQTMNLEAFSDSTPDSEFYRVVRHEVGHCLGFPHEHLRKQLVQRLDPQKTILYFMRTQHWSSAMVQSQVLTPLDDILLKESPEADQVSIMCYQLPGSITRDGRPILGGTDIDEMDKKYAASWYPPINPPPPPPPNPPAGYGTVVFGGTAPTPGVTYKIVPA